ncbi:MAG: hypothetical protein M1839_001242 [Geoglossum umbratile]|nr:MAG: hypothetical protein M1839_001242 [Geoglossum umbratile]
MKSISHLLGQQPQLLPEQSERFMWQIGSNNAQLSAGDHTLRMRNLGLPAELSPPLPTNLTLQVKKKNGSTRKQALTGVEASECWQKALTRAQKMAIVVQEAQNVKKGQLLPAPAPKQQTRIQKAAAMLAEQQEIDEAEDI